jgi:4-carboxymuconolactone decarboxylase
MSNGDLYEQGLKIRRQVLGAEHVDRSLANASDFARPLQEMVTTNCWGGIWTRPGLTLRERSLINIGMLTAMGRLHELRVHVRGALNNGATREELQEVLLQSAIYCGLPAALDASRAVEQVLDGDA